MDSAFIAEAADAYRAALKAGRRLVAERNAEGRSGLLPVLEPLLAGSGGEIPLGLFEIPLQKIRGTFAAGRSHALSAGFLPLLEEKSEFAAKWQALCASALEKGITQPIKVYEYIGHYYVLEGHKRVSVANALSNYSLHADVTRLIPLPGVETPDIAVYNELLGNDRKKVIKHMWFSSPGRYPELLGMAGGDQELLEDSFAAFRAAYHKQGYHQDLHEITTGDAFWQYAKIYGLPDGAHEKELQKTLTRCRPQWELLANPEPVQTVTTPSAARVKPFIHFQRGSLPSVTFSISTHSPFSAEAHQAGCFLLKRAFPELSVTTVEGLPDETKGDVLFVTDPAYTGQALRAALEHKHSLVYLCHDEPVGVTGTYTAEPKEAAFLLGVLAGSLSASARVGWLRPAYCHGGRGHDVQAFAQGAIASRPAARVYTAGVEDREAFRRWAERGVDMVVMPRMPLGTRPSVKAFPGVYAALCSLSQNGAVVEKLAAASLHWEAFYIRLIKGIIEGVSPPDHIHYRMGLDSGVLGLHLTSHASGAKQCLDAFRHALTSGLIAPVDEKSPVEVYET
ncbi:MAG: hypothetical protein FWG31_09510 [Oscillospiraceae bacterium]|nr:hypothetical protein [Oscillospiraceae bacterium]